MENQQQINEELIKQEIEQLLDACPSIEICAKIQNPDERKWCISYVMKYVTEYGFTIPEGIGQLDQFLTELHN